MMFGSVMPGGGPAGGFPGPRTPVRPAGLRSAAAVLAAGLGFLIACDGDNLFTPGSGAGPRGPAGAPPVVAILQPAPAMTVPVEDSVLVEVSAQHPAGIARIELMGVALRGDPDLGTDMAVTRFEPRVVDLESLVPRDTVVRRYLTRGADQANEDVYIIALVTNVHGNVGADTVGIFVGGPRVQIEHPATGQQVRAGRHLALRLTVGDPFGITSYQINYTGVTSGTITGGFSPARTEATIDTVIALPPGVDGAITIEAAGQNAMGMVGRSAPVVIDVTSAAPPDDEPPVVAVHVVAPPRMELTDSLRVVVTARDDDGGTGLQRIGITALALNLARSDTLVLRDSVVYSPPRTGTVVREFRFPPFAMDPMELPDTIIYQVHAFAYDGEANCGASVAQTAQSLACETGQTVGGHSVTLAAGMPGQRAEVIVVTGRTVDLPNGGVIADAVVDTPRRRLYLSNFSSNKVEVLNLETYIFAPPVLVGSQPWGMALNRAGDTLIVANSGGTNLSMVHLDGIPAERDRLFTPNTPLFQLRINRDAFGRERVSGTFIDFSDRPQFVAQDAEGRILYSTVPTPAAQDGTIRVAETTPAGGTEVRILFDPGDALTDNPDAVAIAGADSIFIRSTEFGDEVIIFTHVAGFPNQVVSSGWLPAREAAATAAALPGVQLFQASGTWDVSKFALSDTTFVAASGDRRWIAFGEGASSPFGRIMMWSSVSAGLSANVAVADLVSNAAERVHGVGLNQDGTIGVARGEQAAYFFTSDLRQQGRFEQGLHGGGAGATLHPDHGAYTQTGSDATSLAFVGTSYNTVKVIDVYHFFQRGEIHIRDNIVGPLRASPPMPADNLGVPQNHPDRVLVKLYGISSSGGVVVVDVRRRHIQ